MTMLSTSPCGPPKKRLKTNFNTGFASSKDKKKEKEKEKERNVKTKTMRQIEKRKGNCKKRTTSRDGLQNWLRTEKNKEKDRKTKK